MTREATILRARREELHLRQTDICAETGMSLQQYQRFEYGTRDITRLNAKDYLRICAALELDPFELAFENGVDLADGK